MVNASSFDSMVCLVFVEPNASKVRMQLLLVDLMTAMLLVEVHVPLVEELFRDHSKQGWPQISVSRHLHPLIRRSMVQLQEWSLIFSPLVNST
jgi:hypothetical protein